MFGVGVLASARPGNPSEVVIVIGTPGEPAAGNLGHGSAGHGSAGHGSAGHGSAGHGSASHGHDAGEMSGMLRDEAFWNERYRSSSALWSGNPNPQLVTEAADLVPGTALDAGCGEGADAIWLAKRGWLVTAVDLSTVALKRGAAHAEQAGADTGQRISWQQADLTSLAPDAACYDLVSAQFLQLPADLREPLHRRLADSVAPGGTLLIVGHHPSDLSSGVPRPPLPGLFFTASQAAACLDPGQWTVVTDEARPRTATDPDGRVVTIHDAVLRATRRPG
jgi:SAM-dependent methyltransferase